jgi:eukaryotic-like serine/threonine-protein kinase
MMGCYELLEEIGKGAMGTVYRARNPETSQVVAIKVMAAEAACQPILVKRFEQEFIAASRLRHPHIVRALDFGLHGGRPYLVMEFVEGRNLTQHIVRQGRIPQREAVRILLQVADALQWAHQHQLIHRDVKSDNILLTTDGQAKLTDLGLSKDLLGEEGLTRTRTCLGTIAFVAPEQYEDAKRANVRSDIYGLGVTLYHALTGVLPFQGRRNLQVLRKKLQTDFAPAGSLVPGLPSQIDEVIRKAMDASPARRQGSCQEFIESLTAGRGAASDGGREEEAGPAADPKDRRRAVRYPTHLEASCRSVHEVRRRWGAEVQDISTTGVCLRMGRRFEQGAVLAVEVLDEQSQSTSTLYAKVLWVRKTAAKEWETGCAFNSPLDAGELDTYLNKPRTVVMVRN